MANESDEVCVNYGYSCEQSRLDFLSLSESGMTKYITGLTGLSGLTGAIVFITGAKGMFR